MLKLMTLGSPVWPCTISSRCHCMKVEKVATLKDSLQAPSLAGVFQERIIYSLCTPNLQWNSDESQWHTAREVMRYPSCNHVHVRSVYSANGAKTLESMVLKIPRADGFNVLHSRQGYI